MSSGFASQRNWLSWVLVGIILVASLAYGAIDDGGPQSDLERASALESSIRCPQCTGQSVAESDVAIARAIRADIRKRIDAGESDDTIRAAYVEDWGESILLTPAGTGFVSLVWVIPVVAAALGAAALALAFRRWRQDLVPESGERDTAAAEADEALVARARESRTTVTSADTAADTTAGSELP